MTDSDVIHIHQRYGTDCGVAVVAMLAQVTWEEAELAMFPTMPDGSPRRPKAIRTYWTSTEEDVRRGLEHFGLRILTEPGGGFSAARDSWSDVVACTGSYDFGLLREQMRPDGNWHWTILEGSTGRIFDPDPHEKPKYYRDRLPPHSFWVVVRPNVVDLNSRRKEAIRNLPSYQVAKMRLEEGDVLIVKVRGLSTKAVERIGDHVSKALGIDKDCLKLPILILDEHVDFSVLTAKDVIDKLAEQRAEQSS